MNDARVSTEPTDHEQILHPSGIKWLAILLVSASAVVFGVLMPPEEPFVAWAGIVLLGLGVVVSAVALLPGSSYLRLTPEGFEQRAFFRTSKWSWQQFERFHAYRPPASPIRLVGFVFDPNVKGDATLRRVNRSMAGVDGGLSDTYGLAADELATLMNEWLNRYKRQ
jgi:hypothetical protein